MHAIFRDAQPITHIVGRSPFRVPVLVFWLSRPSSQPQSPPASSSSHSPPRPFALLHVRRHSPGCLKALEDIVQCWISTLSLRSVALNVALRNVSASAPLRPSYVLSCSSTPEKERSVAPSSTSAVFVASHISHADSAALESGCVCVCVCGVCKVRMRRGRAFKEQSKTVFIPSLRELSARLFMLRRP